MLGRIGLVCLLKEIKIYQLESQKQLTFSDLQVTAHSQTDRNPLYVYIQRTNNLTLACISCTNAGQIFCMHCTVTVFNFLNANTA